MSKSITAGDRWVEITPNDATDIAEQPAAIYVGGAGDIEMHGRDGVAATFADVPIGLHALQPRRILATGTTATGIVAVYNT